MCSDIGIKQTKNEITGNFLLLEASNICGAKTFRVQKINNEMQLSVFSSLKHNTPLYEAFDKNRPIFLKILNGQIKEAI